MNIKDFKKIFVNLKQNKIISKNNISNKLLIK